MGVPRTNLGSRDYAWNERGEKRKRTCDSVWLRFHFCHEIRFQTEHGFVFVSTILGQTWFRLLVLEPNEQIVVVSFLLLSVAYIGDEDD